MPPPAGVAPCEEPIAIIGMAGRYPGGIDGPEALWQALVEGRDLIERVPAERWRAEAFYGPMADSGAGPARHASPWGGFLRDVDRFDAAFFGISPREADTMDPAQRILLEMAWRCWEDACLAPTAWSERPVGVFVGGFTQDYQFLQMGDPLDLSAKLHTATGVLQTLLSNRISHFFRLTGPSMTIDTACSSGLVALDLAVSSLHRGDCELAMAGAVQLQLVPHYTTIESVGGFLSPSGRCRAFDRRADGYVRAESGGMVLLAPLSRALDERWPIHAVVMATAVSHNGAVPAITLPDADAQARLIRTALARANLGPEKIGYVEAHGTGTRAGDRAELTAFGQVFGERSAPLWIGSIKTNLGHAEAAAGLNGLAKAILCLRHRRIPPHLHWQEPPDGIDPAVLGLRLPDSAKPWPEDSPYAGVSAFGFGGANAHVILGPPPARHGPDAPQAASGPSMFFLSGPTPSHLFDQVAALRHHLSESADEGPDIRTMAAASLHQRAHHVHRLHLPGDTRSDVMAACDAYLDRPDAPFWIRGEAGRRRCLCWVFSGMGPQWPAMASGLESTYPVFRSALAACDRIFAALAGFSLVRTCRDCGAADLPTRLAQPLSVFVQISLCALLEHCGVVPDLVVGHSVGEIAAFYVAGMMDLETAVSLVFHRSRLQDPLTGSGGMLAIRHEKAEVYDLASAYGVEIAAVNGPRMVTVSGAATAIDHLAQHLRQRRLPWRKLSVTIPFHSALMDPLEEDFKTAVGGLSFRPPHTPIMSTVSGQEMRMSADTMSFADYWWRNLRDPVLFRAAIDTLAADKDQIVFQEIGTTPVLLRDLSDFAGASGVATLQRGKADDGALVESLGRLHAFGFSPRWSAVVLPPDRPVSLPGAVWRRRSHWSETRSMAAHRLRKMDHPLLGWRHPHAIWTWENAIGSASEWAWADHHVMGRARVPAALYLEVLAAAWRRMSGDGPVRLTEIRLHMGALEEDGQIRLRTYGDPETGRLSICDRLGDGQELVSATAVTTLTSAGVPTIRAADGEQRWPRDWIGSQYYEALGELGFDYGPSFRGIERISFSASAGRARICGEAIPGVDFPPTVLDAALQTMLHVEVFAFDPETPQASDRLPHEIAEVRFFGAVGPQSFPLEAVSSLVHRDDTKTIGDLTLSDRDGALLLTLRGVTLRKIPAPSALAGGRRPDECIYRTTWVPLGDAGQSDGDIAPRHRWLVLTGPNGAGRSFAAWLAEKGEQVADGFTHDAAGYGDMRVVSFQAIGATCDPGPEDIDRLSAIITDLRDICRRLAAPAKLWLMTDGAFPEEGPGRPLQSAVWGLARAAGEAEHSDIFGGIIDLPQVRPADWCERLYRLMSAARSETQFRLGAHGGVTAPSIARCPVASRPKPFVLRQGGSYVITGGFGALGRQAAGLFARLGAGSLILVARQALPPRWLWDQPQPAHVTQRIDFVRRLEQAGVRVTTVSLDIGSPDAVAQFGAIVRAADLPVIRGIVHAAGALADKALIQTTQTDVEQVLGPKMTGIAALLEGVAVDELDFVLLYSSISGLLPIYGQALYAAANGYLDGMASWLSHRGVPAQSVAWGPWTVGMAGAGHRAAVLRGQGFKPITPEEGEQLLTLGLGLSDAQVISASVDWATLSRRRPKSHWLISNLVQEAAGTLGTVRPSADRPPPDLMSRDRAGQISLVTERLAVIAASVMGMSPAALGRDCVLVNVGMDSLMAVEIQSRVSLELGAELAIADLLSPRALTVIAMAVIESLTRPRSGASTPP